MFHEGRVKGLAMCMRKVRPAQGKACATKESLVGCSLRGGLAAGAALGKRAWALGQGGGVFPFCRSVQAGARSCGA